jgi:hypothetical protein
MNGGDYSERLYSALLSLYPRRFRTRFGGEMRQMFRDCSGSDMLQVWLRTFMDLIVTIPREWRREMLRVDSEIDFRGLSDAIMVTSVVGTLLLGWGWTGAVLALDLKTPILWTPAAVILVVFVTCVVAVLIGMVSALFVARNHSFERPRLKG